MGFPKGLRVRSHVATWTILTLLASTSFAEGGVRLLASEEQAVAAAEDGSFLLPALLGLVVGALAVLAYRQHRRITQLLEEAEAARRMRSSFLADVSHEIRAPLHVIQGYADLLADESSLDGESRRSLRAIQRSGRHLSDLLAGVLDLSKIEAGLFEVETDPFSVLDVLEEVKAIFRPQASSQGVQLTVYWDSDAELCWVRGDRGKLRQILANLTASAIRRTTSGSVELRAKVEDGTLISQVIDSGRAIEPTELEQIFARYERGERTGAGLGLAISRALAIGLGGSLEGAPREHQGSEFSLRLPYSPCHEIPQSQEEGPLQLENGESLRILIVDDDTEQQEVSTRIVEHMGANVICASNAASARTMLAQEVPHVALIDLEMPREDGYTLLRVLSKTEPRPLLIAVSVSALQSDREASMAAGAAAFIPKPIDKGQLVRILGEHLPLTQGTNEPKRDAGRPRTHQ